MEDIIDIIVTETTNTIEITAQPNDEVIDVNIIDNREDIVLNVTPTVVEININSLTGNFGVEWGDITGTLADQTDLQNVLNLKADLVDGKVPSSQLPSYVDDVVEVANFASLPATGEIGKIYIILDTNKIYRWSGSVYVEIADSSAVWGAITGTLSSQTDLQNALDAKLNVTTASSTYVPYTGATTNVDLGANDLTSRYLTANGASALGGVVNIKQDATYLPKGNGFSSIASSFTAFDFFGYTGASTYKNFSLRFDGLTNNTLRTLTIPNASGTIALTSDLSAYVPYTGANANVNLGAFDLTADVITGATGSFTSSGSGNTLSINHSSGSGIALNIEKAGNGEGLYINKTSGSGNAATIVGTLNATTLVKSGGTSAQFLKADGSVDSSVYALDADVVKLTGAQTIAGVKTFSNNVKLDGDLFIKQDSSIGPIAGYNVIAADTGGYFLRVGTASSHAYLSLGLLTQFHSFSFPDSSGTLALTSNLSSYLPLSGGTLTGALSGTSATFTNNSNVNNIISASNLTSGAGIQIDNSARASGSKFSLMVGNVANGSFSIKDESNNATRFEIASTGAATFSSSVTASTTLSARIGFSSAGTNASPFFDEAIILGQGTNQSKIQYGNSFGSSAGTWMKFVVNSNTASNTPVDVMTLSYLGNVGIGTSAPTRKLSILANPAVAGDEGIDVNNGSTRFLFVRTGSSYTYRGVPASAGMIYSDTNISMLSDGGFLSYHTSGGERMRITADGYARLSSSSGGIQFNGDTAAANALDDYEEGTHSPNAQPAGGGAFTTVTQSGSYVKVGQMVNYSFIININSVGTGSGDVLITLPFVCGLTPIRPMGSGRENALYGNTLQVRTVSDGSAGALVIGGGILMNSWQALCTITYRTTA